jgi:ribosomal protein S18 acetylase RimI-like enzyme
VIIFELLTERHDVSRFRSGNTILDNYLRHEALREQADDIARVFVAIDTEEDATSPAGYIALKTTGCFVSKRSDTVPSDTFLYPAEIGCLARDLRWRGKGLGELLVMEAMSRIERTSHEIGLPGIYLNATREGASLYERFGFQQMPEQEQDYYIPMVAVRELLEELRAR